MIDRSLLALTDFQALGILVYGGPGSRKTNGIHTCPPPILHNDLEGGSSSLMPWIRRRRRYNEKSWTEVSDDLRTQAFLMLSDDNKKFCNEVTRIAPAPYIDVVYYDVLDPASYEEYARVVATFDSKLYNTLTTDSLQELSTETQTYAKKQKGMDPLEPMHVSLWSNAQERAKIQMRKVKNYRDQGVFVYFTCSETIDKDYVTDPRSAQPGSAPEQPYSVKGTANVPGQLAPTIQHVCDLMIHTRALSGQTVWVTKPEPLPGGSAHWEAKDRTGRISNHYNDPNVRKILDQIYGQEIRKRIYGEGIALATGR
jgi:hypothetical protein